MLFNMTKMLPVGVGSAANILDPRKLLLGGKPVVQLGSCLAGVSVNG
jgi:hypothetical protein